MTATLCKTSEQNLSAHFILLTLKLNQVNKEEYLANGKLDFTVSKQKMAYEAVLDVEQLELKYRDTPFFCTVNDKTGEALGPVRSRYTVIQNKDLLDSILDKLEPGSYDLDNSRCGMFNGGRKIYFFIKLNQGISIGSDAADVYLYALSSHDGSQRLVYGISTRMHSCQNMFGLLMSDKDNNHVVKHTKRINNQDNRYINEMVNRNTQGLVKLFNVMRQHEVPLDFREKFLDIVGKIDGKKRVSTVIKDRRVDLLNSCVTEMQDKGTTYYGLFNGLTHYLTHKHKEYTNHSHDYEMLVGNSNAYVKNALTQIVKNMQSNGISLN